MLGVGRSVHGTALVCGKQNVSIGMRDINSSFEVPARNGRARPEGSIGSVFVAVRDIERSGRRLRDSGEKLHYSAESVAAIEAGRTDPEDFKAREIRAGSAAPVHAAA